MKPVVGIVARHNKKITRRPNTYIRDEIRTAILDNGGLPIGICSPKPYVDTLDDTLFGGKVENISALLTTSEKQTLIDSIKLCHGVVLQGGAVSNNFELFVAKYCHDNDIPLLDICAGQNNVVRGNGGSIKNVANPEFHDNPDDTYVHDMYIDADSHFYKIVKAKTVKINSRHQNVVDIVPPNFRVAATDPDGNIEVIEDASKLFCLATRFHPESLYKIDKRHNAIFKAFISACKKYAENKK